MERLQDTNAYIIRSADAIIETLRQSRDVLIKHVALCQKLKFATVDRTDQRRLEAMSSALSRLDDEFESLIEKHKEFDPWD
jgi:hypothetical protein